MSPVEGIPGEQFNGIKALFTCFHMHAGSVCIHFNLKKVMFLGTLPISFCTSDLGG